MNPQLPMNNLDEQLARFVANRKSQSVASTPQINRKFTFRKISSLEKAPSVNINNAALQSVENWTAKEQKTNNSSTNFVKTSSSNTFQKTIPTFQFKSQAKSSIASKKQTQQTITNLFQRNSQKVASQVPKTQNDAWKSSLISDDFDSLFDDLNDFDLSTSRIGSNIELPSKKPSRESDSKSKIDQKQLPVNNIRQTDHTESKGIKARTFSEFPESTSLLGDFPIVIQDDDCDEILFSANRKKKPVCIISDDESDGESNKTPAIDKNKSENKVEILDDFELDDDFSPADMFLRSKDNNNSKTGQFSANCSFSGDSKPVHRFSEALPSKSFESTKIPARTSAPSHLNINEIKRFTEFENHPLLQKNHFQAETKNSLQSHLTSLKELNLSVMNEICSVLESNPTLLSQNKSLDSLIKTRSRILCQYKAAENAMNSKENYLVTKSVASLGETSNRIAQGSENSFVSSKVLYKLQSTPLFRPTTGASSSFETPNFNGQMSPNASTSVISNVSYNSGAEKSDLNNSRSVTPDGLDINIDDFEEEDVFDFDDCDIPSSVAPAQTVIHDIYGKGPDVTVRNNSNSLSNKAVAGKFYGNYRDDGTSPQFKGLNFPHSKDLMETFRNIFGLKNFRYNQLEAINAALLNEDCFILMPTGGGKSLCYQLPALLNTGVTIVVSPLRSLIMDQVQKLSSLDIPASSLSGDVEASVVNNVYRQLACRNPDIKLLYVTPEKISASNKLLTALEGLFTRKMLARFVIDEAHCVSQWGHDFRPDYKRLKVLREKFPGVPLIALTATATPRVRVDILQQLSMPAPKWFLQSFNRPNLKYEVRPKKHKSVVQDIIDLIKSRFRNMSGIVYCHSRKDCDSVAAELGESGIKAVSYHAGLDNRNHIQEMWINDNFKVVCATIAFGMGIDKPDVRFVIHHTIPKSIEGYYQESGRAGRDGELSWCIVFYSYQDMHRIKRMIERDEANRRTWNTHFSNLFKMVHYCENKTDCRRVQMLEYFGEVFDKKLCSMCPRAECDNCFSKDIFEACDVTEDAKAILQCVASLVGQNRRKNYTLTYFVDIFKGSKTQKILAAGHADLPLHGRGNKYSRSDAERLLRKLVLEQFLQENLVINQLDLPNSYVYLGKRANELLQGQAQVVFPIKKDSKNRTSLQVVAVQEDEEMMQLTERCYNELIEVSKAIAADRQMHYTNVVNVEALRQMSREMPMNEEDMLLIPHITRVIYDKYGQKFLDVTQKYGAEKCVIEAERADKKMLLEFDDDNNDNWSNPTSPAAHRPGKFSGKRKRQGRGPPAKRNRKYFQSKNSNARWKKNKTSKQSKSESSASTNFKYKSPKSNFSASTSGRVPGFLPVPKPQSKTFSRSFLPTPRVTST